MIMNSRGFTIAENLVAIAIGLIVMSAVLAGLMHVTQVKNSMQGRTTEDKQVTQIIENVRGAVETYQITFDSSAAVRESLLKTELLPMAWSSNIVTTREQCNDCPGRFGFVIQPYEGMRGLFLVTIRMTNTGWQDEYKDYQFVVSIR